MRVVLDTNVLVSALISPAGAPNILFQAWRDGRFVLVTSEEQLEEFRRVSRYPRLRAFLQASSAGTMLNEIRQLAQIVSRLPKVDVSSDPADNIILATALAGHAEYLVTGDKADLLALRRYKAVRLISVAQMIDWLGT